eukprot:444882-Amphidinium_carterae.1
MYLGRNSLEKKRFVHLVTPICAVLVQGNLAVGVQVQLPPSVLVADINSNENVFPFVQGRLNCGIR